MPLRPSGWATRRTPLWVFAVLAVARRSACSSSPCRTSRPSRSGPATSPAYFRDVKARHRVLRGGAARLGERLPAGARRRHGRTPRPRESIFTYGAYNCTLASNQALTDFAGYQVTESLARYNLDTADNDVITWSFDATAVQQDMIAVLKAGHAGAARHGPGDADRRAGEAGRAASRHLRHLAQRGEDRGSSAALPYLPA